MIGRGQPPRAQSGLLKQRAWEWRETPKAEWKISPSTGPRGIWIFAGLKDEEELQGDRKERVHELEKESRKRHPESKERVSRRE